jgi:hypothetical protein
MMVSMAIAAAVVLTAAYLLRGTSDTYGRVGAGIGAEREARAAIQQLRTDLESAVHHPDSTLAGDVPAFGFLTLKPAAAQSPANRIGDLCAVRYRLADIAADGRVIRSLVRGIHESAPTFDALAAGSLPALTGTPGSLEEPLAFGVVGFSATPVVRDPGGPWQPWTPGAASPPSAIEIRLVIAREKITGRLRTAADWLAIANRPGDPSDDGVLEIYQTRIRYGPDDDA